MSKLSAECTHFAENDANESLCIMTVGEGLIFHLERQVEYHEVTVVSTIGYFNDLSLAERIFLTSAKQEGMTITEWPSSRSQQVA